MIEILRISESEILECVTFSMKKPVRVHVSFDMEDGSFEKMDYETFQGCIRSTINNGKPLNFRKLKLNKMKYYKSRLKRYFSSIKSNNVK